MEDKPEASIPFATGGIVKGPLTGVIGCGCGYVGYLIPPGKLRVTDEGDLRAIRRTGDKSMKIRMKNDHAVIEEVGEVIGKFGETFMQTVYARKGARDGQYHVFQASDWEPVPERIWKDVTAECRWNERTGYFVHVVSNGLGGSYTPCILENGYRVRQVNVSFTGKGAKNGCQPGYAFIIEKQS